VDAARRAAALELADPVQPIATIATTPARRATTAIRRECLRVAISVTLDKEEQVRKIALFGLVLFAATAAAAAASSGGLPNIGTPSMKAQPVYRGYYDHHIDTYLITDVSSKS
jgi:hypothetical protein